MKNAVPTPTSKPFETEVLRKELDNIRARREKYFSDEHGQKDSSGSASDDKASADEKEPPSRLRELGSHFAGAHRMRPLGLGLSGGGIRSATFNLGVLQGLSELGLLPYVDYLATVSGGGYVGSWLHGLIRNKFNGDVRAAADFLSPEKDPVPGLPDDDPVSFLRKYSNYLAPRPGLFSADTWVIGAIWLRNVLLNQLILIPALCSVLIALLVLGFVQQWAVTPEARFVPAVGIAIAFGLLAFATLIVAGNLKQIVEQTFPPRKPPQTASSRHSKPNTGGRGRKPWFELVSRWSVACVFGSSVLLASIGMDLESWASRVVLGLVLAVLFGGLLYNNGFVLCFKTRHATPDAWRAWLLLLWIAPASAALTAYLLFWVFQWQQQADLWVRLAFAPPLISLSLICGVGLLIGLLGLDYPDAAREWTARIGALIGLACVAWTGLFVIAVFAPFGIIWLFAHWKWTGAVPIGGWMATTAAGVLRARSDKTSGTSEKANGKGIIDKLLGGAPAVFMIGYLSLLALGVHFVLRHFTPNSTPSVAGETSALVRFFQPVEHDYFLRVLSFFHWGTSVFGPVTENPLTLSIVLLLICIAVTLIASSRFNINEFSLHHFYKNRLVRCYLGASNASKRKPNKLTGFDPNDDFLLASLVPTSSVPYYGPYAIVTGALNLNVGSELAKQERKSTSFVFTPEYCGFEPTVSQADKRSLETGVFEEYGYHPTKGYAYPQGLHLGTTMAISGAAANPNSGFHTSGAIAFLLTVFDARLGWWLGNPRRPGPSRYPGPVFALRYLMAELFAQTNGRSNFVNVSDGGHFDNLGLYELVRRRCRYIIIGDAEQDGDLTFGSLGNAIRMVRADFGVEIDINPDPVRLIGGFSKAHCVVGTITYPESEHGESSGFCDGELGAPGGNTKARGWLLYLKSSLTGDEPADVIEYRSRFNLFPHQSTADQFFSESQFESYRRLGLHIVRDAFEGAILKPPAATWKDTQVLEIFQSVARKWYAPMPITEEAASRLTDAYAALMRRISESPYLSPVFGELLETKPGDDAKPWSAAPGQSVSSSVLQPSFGFGLELIQLMENVYTELHLEHAHNRANPRNAGWMRVFCRWIRRDSLWQVWTKARSDYNRLFQKFVDDLRSKGIDDVQSRP